MTITALEVENLRSLIQLSWRPAAGLNLIVGRNGAGKTSLLEAISLAATSKALRPGSARGAIRHGADQLRVVVRFGESLDAGELRYERGRSVRSWRLDGEALKSAVRAYERLPLLILSPETHYATLQDAQVRRAAMYWLLFHVEPLFLETWRRYQRILRQRNAALREGRGLYRIFNPGLAQSGEALAAFWCRAQERLQGPFQEFADRLELQSPVTMRLRSGWGEESLEAALSRSEDGDERLGYTQAGPHRADIQFVLGGHPLGQVGSHGQQKVIVSAWRLALAQCAERAGRPPILLVDDLAAELDSVRRKAFYEVLTDGKSQAFVTAIDTETLPSSATMFHVEHCGYGAS